VRWRGGFARRINLNYSRDQVFSRSTGTLDIALRSTFFLSVIVAVMILGLPVKAESPADNGQIEELFRLDQQDRTGTKIDWREVRACDISRQDAVRAMMLDGQWRTMADFYRATMILRHGSSGDDPRLAYPLISLAASINPTDGRYRLLAAVMWV
jgi:hypothetical protein